MSSHVLQDFKSKHNQEDPAKRVIEFSFTLEDSGPDVAWPLDGNPVVAATARISPNGQLLISGVIVEAEKQTAQDSTTAWSLASSSISAF